MAESIEHASTSRTIGETAVNECKHEGASYCDYKGNWSCVLCNKKIVLLKNKEIDNFVASLLETKRKASERTSAGVLINVDRFLSNK
jgi:hypothetical protein